jgi:branched-chain amino acid aminotransferase
MSDSNLMVVWLNGELVDPATASVHWSDHGITVGDGVFETLKVIDGEPFAVTRHLERLDRSAEGLGMNPLDQATLETGIAEVARALPHGTARLRITATTGPGPMGSSRGTSGPTLLIAAMPIAVDSSPTDVVTVPFTRNPTSATAGLKTTSYAENVVALARAESAGATESLLANTRGELCEGTGSNVFVALDGVLHTPPLTSGCLAGVTRALVIEALDAAGTPVLETALPMDAVDRAEEMFLTSSTRDVQAIRRVDGVELKASPGPLTINAAAAFSEAYGDRRDP